MQIGTDARSGSLGAASLAAGLAIVFGVGLFSYCWLFASDEERVVLHEPIGADARPVTDNGGASGPRLGSQASVIAPDFQDDLVHHSRLSRDWLNAHGFTVGSAALHRLHTLLSGRTELQASAHAVLDFSPGAGALTEPGAGPPRFAQQERYVHANAPSSMVTLGDSVLVRWRNLDNESVLELSAQALAPDTGGARAIWMHRTRDWEVGRYQVEIISADGALVPVAVGVFTVVANGAVITAFAHTETSTTSGSAD